MVGRPPRLPSCGGALAQAPASAGRHGGAVGRWPATIAHITGPWGAALTRITATIACSHSSTHPGGAQLPTGAEGALKDQPAVHGYTRSSAAHRGCSRSLIAGNISTIQQKHCAFQAAGMPSSISSDALRPADCSQGCGASQQRISAPLADHQQCAAPAAAVQQLTNASPAKVGLGGRQAVGTEQPAEQAETPQAAVSPLAPACLGSPRGPPAAPPPGPCRA